MGDYNFYMGTFVIKLFQRWIVWVVGHILVWSKLSDAIHLSLIGINPPVGDIKDLMELLKASMHDLEIVLPKPLNCDKSAIVI